MEQHARLVTGTSEKTVDATRYRSVVRSLRYLVNLRPDVAYVVGIVSRFMKTPTKDHWVVVKRIFRYVSGTTEYGCRYLKGKTSDLELLGYNDNDHGDLVHRRSTSGIFFSLYQSW